MAEATDKSAVTPTDDLVLRFVAEIFRPALETLGASSGAASYWHSRYDDLAARLARAEAELERREELLDRLDPVAWGILEAAGIPRDPMVGCWEGIYLLAGDAGAAVVAGLARGRAAEAELAARDALKAGEKK
jgi:hypothetical protein